MGTHRIDKLQGEILKEVRMILLFVLDIPALQQIALTRVLLTKDLSLARVYYETILPDQRRDGLQEELDRQGKRIRKELAQRMRLRAVPEVRFFYDETNETISKVEKLIDSL